MMDLFQREPLQNSIKSSLAPAHGREILVLPNEHIHLFGLKSSATQPISLEQTAGDIFVNALTLYWQNFRVFFLIYLVPSAPFIVIELWAEAAGSEGLAIGAEILSFFVLEMAWAATVIGVSEVCLGGNPTVSGSYSHLTRVLGSFITAFLAIQLCYVALAALGSIPLFLVWLTGASISWLAFGPLLIGSIYTIVLLIFALPVAILEKRRGFSAIHRSIQLSKGYWLRNFGIIMLPLILIIIC